MKLPFVPEIDLENPSGELARSYVTFMLAFMSRGLAAATRVDEATRAESAGLPENFLFEMIVLPEGPSCRLRKVGRSSMTVVPPGEGGKPTLSIQFKHLRHAWRVLSFQESTAIAFASDRMVVDGEISYAMRMVRILNRFQNVSLPEAVARKALKRYEPLSTQEKLGAALRINGRLLRDLF